MAGSLGRPVLLGWAARIEVRALHETFVGWIAYLLSLTQTFECRCPCSYILMCNICSGSINPGSCKFSDHLSTVLLFPFLSAIYSEKEKKVVNQPFQQLRSKRSRKLDNGSFDFLGHGKNF